MTAPINVRFHHGLGDTVQFAHIARLYTSRGYTLNVQVGEDRVFLLGDCGVNINPPGIPDDAYTELFFPHSDVPYLDNPSRPWLYNKTANGIGEAPLPNIGDKEALWNEMLGMRFKMADAYCPEAVALIDSFVNLPGPLILLHTQGNTFTDMKNLPPACALETYKAILDRIDGALILLDWDNRVPRLASGRVRHLQDDWGKIDVPTLWALIDAADLLISVDSGPLHIARFTDTPALGLCHDPYLYPSHMHMPRRKTAHLVQRHRMHETNCKARIDWNIVEDDLVWSAAMPMSPANIAKAADSLLRNKGDGRLAVLTQLVGDYERGYGNSTSDYVDRDKGFKVLFDLMRKRFKLPTIVETGCIRGDDDWRGAGYGTYLLSAYCKWFGGEFYTIDSNESNLEFAIEKCCEASVNAIHGNSAEVLTDFNTIDVLYLDSMDVGIDGYEEHGLAEIMAASDSLHKQSVVVFDDTVWRQGAWYGKGVKAIPWMLGEGWKIEWSGYQVILVRGN